MKKNVLLLSMMFFVCMLATAQVRLQQSTPQFQRVNTQALDAHRQRYSQTAQRMADTPIEIDYGFSDGDTTFFASFINMHFAAPVHNGLERFAVVTFDSLHDAVSNTGHNYSDFDSIRVDSLFFFVGHENNDMQSDTLIVKLVELGAGGYPTDNVLWSRTYTSGAASFVPGQTPATGRWDAVAPLGIGANVKFPASTRFGMRLEYYGAITDTFAYLFSFYNIGPCVNSGLPYTADLSLFYPNSYRYDVANSTLLPTAQGLDYAYDCTGDTLLDSPYIIQNINFTAKLTGLGEPDTSTPGPAICDTITNIFVTDSIRVYLAPAGGYMAGHNGYGDLGKADIYNAPPGSTVPSALFLFGVAEFANANSFITARVWDDNGTGGRPGTVLASTNVPINTLSVFPNPSFVQFNPPANVNGNFYVGITYTYANGDTVALITNHDGNGHPNTAWELWNTGTWEPYSSANGWQLDLAHGILPNLCYPDTTSLCPVITVNANGTNAICTSINGTATATATGGAAPYTYAWSNTQTGGSLTGLAAGTYTVTAMDADGCTGTATVTISVSNVTLSVSATDTDNTSCTTPNGTATATVTGGTPQYSYVWSGGLGVTATINSLAAATYTVTVYDANGCSGTSSTTVGSAPPTITVSLAGPATPNTQCINPNGEATVSATGGTPGYTYQWPASANNQTGATATSLAGGTYTVTATDNAGCTGTGNIVVGTTTPNIVLSVTNSTPSTNCATPDGSATVAANGGTPGYTYQWPASANNQTGATATALAGGTYTVTVTDTTGCTGTGNVTITATTPTITVTITNTTGNSSCTTPNGDATVSVTGGTGPYGVAWSNNDTGTSVSGLANGTYTVTATDANQCTGMNTVTITDNRPVLGVNVATSPVTSCVLDNGSATATESGATGSVTYTWSTSPAQTTATASNLAAGNYTVTVLDQTSGCTVSGSGTVGTNIPAVSVSISSSNDVTSCDAANGSATATGSGGAGAFGYVWSTSPAQTTATATGLAAGNYTVTATSSNGCTASASVTIGTNTATVTVDVTTSAVTSCANPNGSAVAVATGGAQPYTYTWGGGETSSTLNNVAAGVYSVTVEDANGCEGSDNGTVGTSVNVPTVSATVVENESGLGENDGSATATGNGGNSPYTYAWSTSPAQTTATATGLGEGTYTVTLTDAQGCTATATASILQVGIALPADVASLSIFPNPTTDVVNVRMELKEANTVKIEWFNALGQKVINREFTRVNNVTETFSMNALPEGIYMTRITVGAESVTSRVSVVR